MFLPQEVIAQKRDGKALSAEAIGQFVDGITDGTVNDAQTAAMAMAILLKGMARDERVALTMAMARSGSVLDWSDAGFDGPVIDKHSTGGVGDKVSLILAPVLAACGGYVPMISGRGLGHTGGTLDKLDSIPGYRSQPDTDELRSVTGKVGCAIIGATADIAPADRRLYSIRDVTGTVESIDLITASILSKKLAAGLDALILDVKVGNGAFMDNLDDARALAESLVSVGNGAGMRTAALLTDMNQVLGSTAGNAVEVAECVAVLRGEETEDRLREVTLALAAELLALGGLAGDAREGRMKAERALTSGQAAERFSAMVTALGGPSDFMDAADRHLPTAPVTKPIFAKQNGTISAINTRALGIAIVAIGGGRTDPLAAIDHAVGLTSIAGLGQHVGPSDRPLALAHVQTPDDLARVSEAVNQAFQIGGPPEVNQIIAGNILPAD